MTGRRKGYEKSQGKVGEPIFLGRTKKALWGSDLERGATAKDALLETVRVGGGNQKGGYKSTRGSQGQPWALWPGGPSPPT